MKSISLWRYCVFCKNILFCQNFRIDYTIHHQWRMKKRERERGYKGRKRERGYKKKPRCEGRGNEKERNPKRVGPAPSRRPHIVKDRIPLGCLDIGTVILIEAMSWAAVVSFYFECLSDFELISKFFLVFSPHCFQHLRVFPVNRMVALFLMLRDARVLPVALLRCSLVFLAPSVYGSDGLADVGRFGIAGTAEFVYAFFLFLVWVCLVFTT